MPSRVSLAWYSAMATRRGGEVPELHAGERWQLAVRLKRPHGTVNPHGFDVEAWLLENDLRATGYVRKDDAQPRGSMHSPAAPSDYVAARARGDTRPHPARARRARPTPA